MLGIPTGSPTARPCPAASGEICAIWCHDEYATSDWSLESTASGTKLPVSAAISSSPPPRRTFFPGALLGTRSRPTIDEADPAELASVCAVILSAAFWASPAGSLELPAPAVVAQTTPAVAPSASAASAIADQRDRFLPRSVSTSRVIARLLRKGDAS